MIMNNIDGAFCTYTKSKLRAKPIFFYRLIAFSRKGEFGETETKIFVENPRTLVQRIFVIKL